MERVSHVIIILRPPQKLVIEVATSGSYIGIEWSKDGISQGTAGFMPPNSSFTHFAETYFSFPTNESDLGVYGASLITSKGQERPRENFVVILQGKRVDVIS